MVNTDVASADRDAVREFIEDFALTMEGAGMHRMSARVFAAVLASEEASMTARELAELLQVSPAAVSGAVRQLETMRFVHRGRAPGHRADHFGLGEPPWYEVLASTPAVFESLQRVLNQGLKVVDTEHGATLRMRESYEFFAYLAKEIPLLVERWHEERP